MNRIRSTLVFVALVGVIVSSQSGHAGRPKIFTVKDSIEMTTFSDPYTRFPDAECKRSPNGKYFFVITTRGVLRTNQLTSTLWLYSTVDVDSYVHDLAGAPPKPRLLFRVIGAPAARQTNSYGSLIEEANWSGNSLSILSLVERPNGERHIFRTYLSGKRSIDLTPGNLDIRSFSEAKETIAILSRSTCYQAR